MHVSCPSGALEYGSCARTGLSWVLAALAMFAGNEFVAAQSHVKPPLTVSGTVIDERGGPAADVHLVLRPYPSRYGLAAHLLSVPGALPDAVDHGRSDTTGAFRLAAPSGGPYRLEIMPPEAEREANAAFAPMYLPLLPLAAPVALEPIMIPDLHPQMVAVVDTDGRPVAGAMAIAIPVGWRSEEGDVAPPAYMQARRYPRSGRTASLTDAAGLARFMLPTRSTIVVTARGYGVSSRRPVSGRVAVELRREPGVAFRVRGPGGWPASQAVITTADDLRVPLAITDGRGEAAVSGAEGLMYAIENAGRLQANWWFRDRVGAGAREDEIVDVVLKRPVSVRGQVVDAGSGTTIPGAVVWDRLQPGRLVRADSFGVFELAVQSRHAKARLSAVAPGYVRGHVDVSIPQLQEPPAFRVGLTPTAPLSGRVVDGSGSPVAGARVWIGLSDAGVALHPPRNALERVTSGPGGFFRVPDALYDRSYRLVVEAEGYAVARRTVPPLERGLPAGPIRIVLNEGLRVGGAVVDVDGDPIVSAQVQLEWSRGDSELSATALARTAAEIATTDDLGTFEFSRVGPGTYGLSVTHSEYIGLRGKRVSVGGGGSETDLGSFTLAPGVDIHGVVVDSFSRSPVVGATVRVQQGALLSGSFRPRTAGTERDGRFRVAGLHSAPVDLGVSADGYAPVAIQALRPGTGQSILVELQKGASLVGRVLDSRGAGAANVDVRLYAPLGNGARSTRGLPPEHAFPSVRTDREGRFSLENLASGRWSVESRDETSAARLESIDLVAGQISEVVLQMQTRNRLRIHVTNRLGQPLAGAEVTLDYGAPNVPPELGRTDASGQATLSVAAGSAVVVATHPEHLRALRKVVLEDGLNETWFQLDPGWEVTGSVRSADGTPVGMVAIEASPELPGAATEAGLLFRRYISVVSPRVRTVSDANGRFRLTGLERGRYLLNATAPGYAEAGATQVIDVDGRSVNGLDIVLERAASIRGVVTGLRPLELGSLRVDAWKGGQLRTALADARGGFELHDLPVGSWRLVASVGGLGGRSVGCSVALEPEGSGEVVELRFEPGLRLSGQVFVDGQVIAGTAIDFFRSGRDIPQRATIDHEGHFVIEGVRPGVYALSVTTDSEVLERRTLNLLGDRHLFLALAVGQGHAGRGLALELRLADSQSGDHLEASGFSSPLEIEQQRRQACS